jgi:hypothetical protein
VWPQSHSRDCNLVWRGCREVQGTGDDKYEVVMGSLCVQAQGSCAVTCMCLIVFSSPLFHTKRLQGGGREWGTMSMRWQWAVFMCRHKVRG